MKIKVKVVEKSYEIEIKDLNTLPIIASIGDEIFEIWPEKREMPPANTQRPPEPHFPGMVSNSKTRIVLSPLPGIISEIYIKPGSKISKGTPLLVIDAMKMKNKIHAGRSGTISIVHINIGDQVNHNQALIEFSEQED